MLIAYVLGRWQLFAKSGFKRAPQEGWDAAAQVPVRMTWHDLSDARASPLRLTLSLGSRAAQASRTAPSRFLALRRAGTAFGRPPAAAGRVASSRARQRGSARDAAAPASRWQADLERLDADLRLRLLTAHEPRADWVAGELDAADIDVAGAPLRRGPRSGARRARSTWPRLRVACLQPVQPAARRRARRSTGSPTGRRATTTTAFPSLLSRRSRAAARRARPGRRRYVEQAATAPRFDDYWSEGALALVGVPAAAARRRRSCGARPEAASNYALTRALRLGVARCARSAPNRAVAAPAMRAGCAELGQAMA